MSSSGDEKERVESDKEEETKKEVEDKEEDKEKEDEPSESEEEEKPKKKKKAKKAKGERKAKKKKEGPKRALTAYFFFTQANREQARKENPEMKMTEISKVLGQKWKEVSDEDKKAYEEKAKADKARYKEEKEKWDEEHPHDSDDDDEPKKKKKKGTKRKSRPEGAPKKASSSYNLFMKKKMADFKKTKGEEKTKMTEVMSTISSEWKGLSTEDKKEFEDAAAADKERYAKEKEAWESEHPGEKLDAKKPRKKKAKKAKDSDDEGDDE